MGSRLGNDLDSEQIRRKIMRKVLSAVLFVVAMLCFLIGLNLTTYTTRAVEAGDFIVAKSSIRLAPSEENGDGIRFAVLMKKTMYINYAKSGYELGALIIPTDLIPEAGLTADTENVQKIVTYGVNVDESSNTGSRWMDCDIDGYSDYKMSVVYLWGIPEGCYNRPVSVVGYAKNADGAYIYSSEMSKSLSDVALAEYKATGNEDMKKYLQNFVVEFYDADNQKITQNFYSYTFGDAFNVPNVPETKDGLVFDGWQEYIETVDSTDVYSEKIITDFSDKYVRYSTKYRAHYGRPSKTLTDGDIKYNVQTGKAVSTVQDNYVYFAGGTIAENQAFMITATVEKFDNDWRSVGFAVKIGEKVYRFVLRKSAAGGVNGNCYDMVAWHNSTVDQPAMPNDALKTNPFIQAGETANIALAYSNATYYFYINGTLCHTVREADDGARQLGLFCEQPGVVYTDWGYTTDFETFVVSGTTAAGATVIVSSQSGAEAGRATADVQGNWSVTLAAGTYPVIAETATHISISQNIEIAEASVTGVDLTPNKLKLTDGDIKYNVQTGKAESNVMYGSTSQIAGAVVNSNAAYMLTATVEKFVCAWASAGFEVKFAEKQYRFVLRYNGTKNCYDMVAWHNTAADQPEIGKAEYASDPFTKTGNTAELALIYKDGAYYFMINGEIFHTVTEADNEQVQLGLYCEQQQEIEKIAFTAWDYSAEQSAYAKYLEKTLTLSGGITASVNGQTVTNGKVLLGDTVTVSLDVAEGQSGTFSVDGNQITTIIEGGKATASFKVTGDHSVTFASVYAVSGNVTAAEGLNSTGDITVVIANEAGEKVYDGTAQNGAFTTSLIAGTYSVVATSGNLVSAAQSITVSNASVGNVAIELSKPKITGTVATTGSVTITGDYHGLPAFDSATSSYKGTYHAFTGGYFEGVTVPQQNTTFEITATATEASYNASDAYQVAGFVIRSNSRLIRIGLFHNRESDTYAILCRRSDGSEFQVAVSGNAFVDGKAELKVVCVNADNKAAFHTEFYVNGTQIEGAEIWFDWAPDDSAQIGFWLEQDVVITDWGYKVNV